MAGSSLQERNKALEAAKAAEAAEDAAAQAAANQPDSGVAAREAPAGSDDVAQQADLLTTVRVQQSSTMSSDMQRQATLQHRRQLPRRLSMQRNGSLTGRGTRLRNKQYYGGRAVRARPMTAAEKAAQAAVVKGESLG